MLAASTNMTTYIHWVSWSRRNIEGISWKIPYGLPHCMVCRQWFDNRMLVIDPHMHRRSSIEMQAHCKVMSKQRDSEGKLKSNVKYQDIEAYGTRNDGVNIILSFNLSLRTIHEMMNALRVVECWEWLNADWSLVHVENDYFILFLWIKRLFLRLDLVRSTRPNERIKRYNWAILTRYSSRTS